MHSLILFSLTWTLCWLEWTSAVDIDYFGNHKRRPVSHLLIRLYCHSLNFLCPQTVQHGFPHRASALSWDPLLRLAALGTASGALKVYGRPGVEFYGQHTNPDAAIIQIKFIPGKTSTNGSTLLRINKNLSLIFTVYADATLQSIRFSKITTVLLLTVESGLFY